MVGIAESDSLHPQNIAASSQEQSHGVDEISRNMDSINNVIKEAAQSTDEAAQSAETLENKSDILRKTVAQFKVEVAAWLKSYILSFLHHQALLLLN